ncbi:hypothetical protein FXO38_25717 [Capsicum annuum]|nr:hypothetical protein FXO38_25717 [Capsicum annuum]KAF3640345.1 hypothetical protein FXO37_23549 [Capsicum annuum]
MGGKVLSINDSFNNQNEVLNRSLVGNYKVAESPTLSEIRRWGSKIWKQNFGLNIYDRGNNLFLFEFACKAMVEQVMNGEWLWKRAQINFQWWSPTVGAVETEKETQLRNHLKWARIKICGAGSNISKEVTIENGGIRYTIQVWTEAPVSFQVEEKEEDEETEYPLIQSVSRNNMKGKGIVLNNLDHAAPSCTRTSEPLIQNISFKELQEIRTLAYKFLEAFKGWESSTEDHEGIHSIEHDSNNRELHKQTEEETQISS